MSLEYRKCCMFVGKCFSRPY